MASLDFIHVDKRYPDGTSAVRNLNLSARDGEFLIMVGPSGCGKSTALRMAAGLEGITGGELHIDGRAVTHLSPRERDIAMVFQNYALYPHMTVFQNIAFPLENAGLAKAQITARVTQVAQMMGLTEHLGRRPKNLSGGQRQRVAMGRALVRQPKVFLMDEPLSNLDAKLRVQMRAEIIRLQRELGVTTLYVTHDQVEAMTMGDRIAVMRLGVLQQVGTPVDLYENPANLFVAAFIGSPAMSFVEGRLSQDHDPTLTIGAVSFALPAPVQAMLRPHAGRTVAVGIRPEHVLDPHFAPPDAPRLSMTTRLVEVIPPEQIVHLDLVARKVDSPETAEAAADNPNAAGDAAAGRVSITARLPSGRLQRPGETADWALDVAHLHFFDPATGAAIRNSLR